MNVQKKIFYLLILDVTIILYNEVPILIRYMYFYLNQITKQMKYNKQTKIFYLQARPILTTNRNVQLPYRWRQEII